jgi:tryptophan synthase beta chain
MKAFNAYPDEQGHFEQFGGTFVSDLLMSALAELKQAYSEVKSSDSFQQHYWRELQQYVGRETPLYHAERWSTEIGGAAIYFKREDLNHTGAHKINNALGQALLAKSMGKTRIIAETGAGQHGVATATIAARLGMTCVVYMGAEDIARQSINVYRMKLLGAEVRAVHAGTKTLKDALNEAMRDWVTNIDDTFYIIGTAAGPHPYPEMVRDFQSVIGREARAQSLAQFNRLPDYLVACVGGGSNAIGLFHPFLADENVKMIGVEAAGLGIDTNQHAAPLSAGRVGVLHGNRTYLMCDDDGQISPTHSVSAGLDYPGVGPEHAFLKDCGRVEYSSVTDEQALEAFREVTKVEGIMPALESSHALAYTKHLAQQLSQSEIIVVNLSGRGDKDVATIAAIDGIEL